jgi:hypothetical protein
VKRSNKYNQQEGSAFMWIIKTQHKNEDGATVALELESEDGQFDVNVRWDGCMEVHVYSVTEENRELHDTFHTCDVKGFIEKLQSLNGVCAEFFGEGSYWKEKNNNKSDDKNES